jgi:hypothetical protein
MNEKLPIIAQLHNALTDRARADVLLRCSDSIMLTYEHVFLAACRAFPGGEHFVRQRCHAMRAVRSEVGGLPGGMAIELETLRAELAAYAAGAEVSKPTTGTGFMAGEDFIERYYGDEPSRTDL